MSYRAEMAKLAREGFTNRNEKADAIMAALVSAGYERGLNPDGTERGVWAEPTRGEIYTIWIRWGEGNMLVRTVAQARALIVAKGGEVPSWMAGAVDATKVAKYRRTLELVA